MNLRRLHSSIERFHASSHHSGTHKFANVSDKDHQGKEKVAGTQLTSQSPLVNGNLTPALSMLGPGVPQDYSVPVSIQIANYKLGSIQGRLIWDLSAHSRAEHVQSADLDGLSL